MQRRYDMVAFDVDGTLVDDTVFIWETLHRHFKTDATARREAARQYFAGEIDYETWFEHDIQAMRQCGADKNGFEAVLRDMRAMPGALETLQAVKAAGAILVVISGSLNIVVEHFFAPELFDDVLINHVTFRSDGQLQTWTPTPFDLKDKARGLRLLADKHGVSLDRTAFVGDHFNDIDAICSAGMGIAFNCKSEELAQVADVVVPGPDLRAVLPFLMEI